MLLKPSNNSDIPKAIYYYTFMEDHHFCNFITTNTSPMVKLNHLKPIKFKTRVASPYNFLTQSSNKLTTKYQANPDKIILPQTTPFEKQIATSISQHKSINKQ